MTRILVTGAGGFIGTHLVEHLKRHGEWVRGADLHLPAFADTSADEFVEVDLRDPAACLAVTKDVDEVYALAADMGGIGFISGNHAEIFHNNALINIHTIDAARLNGVERFLFTSSACVYPGSLQRTGTRVSLRERDAYPADPPTAYGWEKLTSEKILTAYAAESSMRPRIVRLHNVYGPRGTYEGGREKAPAAIARKVACADEGGVIEIWGDGEQRRSFCYVNDCVEGLRRVMDGDLSQPVNLGSDQDVTINELVALVIEISGKHSLTVRHVDGPQGVRSRNSDNTLLREAFGWAPSTSLRDGMTATYTWVANDIEAKAANSR